jgi:hypothetical protein
LTACQTVWGVPLSIRPNLEVRRYPGPPRFFDRQATAEFAGSPAVGHEAIAFHDDEELGLGDLYWHVCSGGDRIAETIVAVSPRDGSPRPDQQLEVDEGIISIAVAADDHARVAALTCRRNPVRQQLSESTLHRVECPKPSNAPYRGRCRIHDVSDRTGPREHPDRPERN